MPGAQQPEKIPILTTGVRLIREKAILFIINGEPRWIPKSQLHEPKSIQITTEQKLIWVSPWFVKKEGLQ